MSRFGDFTLLEDLGRSAVADRYKAMHSVQGGPFFLKAFTRLDSRLHSELSDRGDRLIGKQHNNLALHLGHGLVGAVPFVVSPWLEGINLVELSASLRDRRVNLTLDHCLIILAELSRAVAALHEVAGASGSPLVHGDVSIGHVRLGPDGQVWLTGLCTPRGLEPRRGAETRLDLAGVGALLYDLVPLLRGGAARPPLPTPLDRVIRRALGIGPVSEHLTPADFGLRLQEVGEALKLNASRQPFVDVVRRTIRAVDKKIMEAGGRTLIGVQPADGIPELVPVAAGSRPTPAHLSTAYPATLGPAPRSGSPLAPALPTLEPLRPRVLPELVPLSAPPPVFGPASALAPRQPAMPSIAIVQTPPLAAPRPSAPAEVLATQVPTPLSHSAEARLATPMPLKLEPELRPLAPLPVAKADPKPRSLFSDADETATTMSTPPPLPHRRPTPTETPPFAPAAESAPVMKDDTDPDAVRPVKIEAQKALPSVQALLQAGVINAAELERAANEQAQRGGRTLEILVTHGVLGDDDVAAVLGKASGRPLIEAKDVVVANVALLRRIPQTYALARRLLPLALENGVLLLAVADPFEIKVIDEVKGLLHASSVDVRVAARKALTETTLAVFGKLHGTNIEASGPRVLLCMHNELKAEKLGDRLAQGGMQVEHVVDGHTAKLILGRLQGTELLTSRPPQAVICSYDLPGLDARALLLHVRDHEATVELPFFVLGPRADDDLITRVLDLGADDFFGEPLRLDVVLAKLRRAIEKGKRHEVSSPGRQAPPRPQAPASMAKAPTAAPPSLVGEFDFAELPDLPPEFEHGPAEPATMPTGVMGTLRQMALPEIVQSLEMGRKTASVDIVPQDGDKGMIGFEGGSVRYAECGELMGEQAFFALMRHKEGFFRIHYGDAPPAMNIDAPTTFLLLEAMRLMDEEGFV